MTSDMQAFCCEFTNFLPYFPESCLRKSCIAGSFEFRRENILLILNGKSS